MPQKISSLKAIVASLGLMLSTLLWPQVVFADGGETQPFTTTYRIEFSGDWTDADHQGTLPGGAHFSPLIGAVHNNEITFWEPGQLASPGIKDMAELGLAGPLTTEINTEINENPPDALSVIAWNGGNIDNTGSATLGPITVNQDFPLISLVSMVAPSSDWFIGVRDLSMMNGNQWRDNMAVDLFPYDAGTEQDANFFSLNNSPENPHKPISSISGVTPFNTNTLGTFTFTRINYADLHLSKNVAPQIEVAPQSAVTYTVVLSNSGDTSAAGAIFTDTLPLNLTFARWLSQPSGAAQNNNQITWTGAVTDGANVVFSYVATYTGSTSGQTVTNQAQFSHTFASGTNSGQASAGFIAQSMAVTDTIPVDPNATATQTVSDAGGEVTIEIPPNVLPVTAATLKYTNLGLTPSTGLTTGLPDNPTIGLVFKLNLFDAGNNQIDNPTFASPITVTAMYSQTLIDLQNIDEDKLQVFFFDEDNNRWETLAVINRDTTNNKITFKVNHLTEFVLVEGDSIAIYLPLMMK